MCVSFYGSTRTERRAPVQEPTSPYWVQGQTEGLRPASLKRQGKPSEHFPAWTVTYCVTLNKLLTLSVLPFSLLEPGEGDDAVSHTSP